MRLEHYKIEGDNITLSRQELEQWRDHYMDVINRTHDWYSCFYNGKHDALVEILNHFDK